MVSIAGVVLGGIFITPKIAEILGRLDYEAARLDHESARFKYNTSPKLSWFLSGNPRMSKRRLKRLLSRGNRIKRVALKISSRKGWEWNKKSDNWTSDDLAGYYRYWQ